MGLFLGKLIARSVRNRPQQKSDRKITFLLSGQCSGTLSVRKLGALAAASLASYPSGIMACYMVN